MRKPQWINPEHLADRCAEIFEIYGVEIPENIYMDIHKFIMDFNFCNQLKPPSVRSICERNRILLEDKQ